MTETLALILGMLALFVAWRAMQQVKVLSKRLAALEPAPQIPDAAAEQAPETAAARPSRAWTPGVRSASLMALGRWLRANWIYPIAGAALVMAAVYLVQYSIERGLLSPQARIALAQSLGGALIVGAEVLRRRFAGTDPGARLVAATLAGAGIVALLAAVLAAFHLYAMLGQGATLAALAVVAVGAMALGWVPVSYTHLTLPTKRIV